ncbi:hypothetical protein F6G07_13880 [Salmonella enterica]|uniref:Uncharacterized protein n=1 Tax=Salmonella enterica subsp. VII serovar 40:z4,z24:[z39] TaxID=1967625 RepID=A0A731XYM8_SALEE|nr:hypothetical protein [Salmonella enterica]EDO5297190.1 hypothetical protein [Salmonella enterica subsp. houtenae serovar 40:z4,z24:-]EDS6438373.1 hypothetical protein [Salmonella enterica subsp. VII str. CFSAN000550]EDT6887149.1 hypothetical protein [Salmonella enterica subsp. enterica]EDU7900235.1 hypothetical protein [Salmonella enterica subsp. houtenae]HAE4732034.1 hypothetical protein [Salmonella enterica subsp. VII serovar 40:z4,z24:[z39]]HCA3676729.1 hypothetical protein [Salmonella 
MAEFLLKPFFHAQITFLRGIHRYSVSGASLGTSLSGVMVDQTTDMTDFIFWWATSCAVFYSVTSPILVR